MRLGFGCLCALTRSRLGTAANTLKITVLEDLDPVTIKLEGRIAGPWVEELERTWRELTPRLNSKRLLLDIRGVTFIEDSGKKLLGEIYEQGNGGFLAETPMTKYVARQAMNGHDAHTTEKE